MCTNLKRPPLQEGPNWAIQYESKSSHWICTSLLDIILFDLHMIYL